jgi:hypothetical protein
LPMLGGGGTGQPNGGQSWLTTDTPCDAA